MGVLTHPTAPQLPLSVHLAEAANRLQRVILFLVIAIGFWAFLIDDLMAIWLASIPLAEGASTLSIYSPYAWLDTKWTAVGLLAFWSILPWFAWEIFRFAKSGLLPRERTWYSNFIATGLVLGSLLLVAIWFWGFPALVGLAQSSATAEGIGAQYDLVSLYQIALAISWYILLFFLLTLALLLARTLKIMSSDPFDAFRVRSHLLCAFLLWIVTPDALEGVFLAQLVTLSASSEWLASLLPKPTQRGRNPVPVLDGFGAERRVMFVDCGCADVCPKINPDCLPEVVGLQRLEALCLNTTEQESLVERVRIDNCTDVVIGGCDGLPLPWGLKRGLASINCNLSGLRLMDRLSSSESARDVLDLTQRLDLAPVAVPWSLTAQKQAQLAVLANTDVTPSIVVVSDLDRAPWGEKLAADEVQLVGDFTGSNELQDFCKSKGITLRMVTR